MLISHNHVVPRELEELGALKDVEEAALAEAEAAAAEAASAGLFDFDDDSDDEDEDISKKKTKKLDKENNSENGGVILNPKNLNEIKPITNQLEIARHENQFKNNGSRESLRYKVTNRDSRTEMLNYLFLHQDVLVLNEIIDRISERPASLLDDDEYEMDDEDEGPKLKDVVKSYLLQGCEVLCVWDCCRAWIKISEVLSFIVFDPFVELFITLCIAVNVVFMSMDQYNVNYDGM